MINFNFGAFLIAACILVGSGAVLLLSFFWSYLKFKNASKAKSYSALKYLSTSFLLLTLAGISIILSLITGIYTEYPLIKILGQISFILFSVFSIIAAIFLIKSAKGFGNER